MDWQHSCLYTLRSMRSQCVPGLADQITIHPQCVSGAFTLVPSCAQALCDCVSITQKTYLNCRCKLATWDCKSRPLQSRLAETTVDLSNLLKFRYWQIESWGRRLCSKKAVAYRSSRAIWYTSHHLIVFCVRNLLCKNTMHIVNTWHQETCLHWSRLLNWLIP